MATIDRLSPAAARWLALALVAFAWAPVLAEDAGDGDDDAEAEVLTPAEEFDSLRGEYGDSSQADTFKKKLRLLHEAQRMAVDKRFLERTEEPDALVAKINKWIATELPGALESRAGELDWDEKGMVEKARILRDLYGFLDDEEMMKLVEDQESLRSHLTEKLATDVATAFDRLARTYTDLERNRDYMKERQRGEIMRAMGELPLAAHAKAVKFKQLAGQFLAKALQKDSSERVKIRALMSLAVLSEEPYTKMIWKFAEGNAKKDTLYFERIADAMERTTDEESMQFVLKKKLLASNPQLRKIAAEALGNMRYSGAVEALIKITKDRDPEVRYEAIVALGKIGDESALTTIVDRLSDQEGIIREAAAFALGEIGQESSLDPLYEVLNNDTEPVARESAVLAIRAIGARDSVDVLISRISQEPMARIKEQIAQTIRELTGSDMTTYDSDIWRSWWEVAKHKKPGEVNTEAAIPEAQRSVVKYYDLDVLSNRVVFILDASCSMEWGNRIRVVKDEFYKTLDQLDEETRFDIVRFASDHVAWSRTITKKQGKTKTTLIEATKENKAKAKEWVEKLLPGGGTNTYETIEATFQDYPEADTIYFLSDGAPSLGRYKLQEKILAEFKKMNRHRKVQIHTIAVLVGSTKEDWGDTGKIFDDKEVCIDFMRRLASEHRGAFVLRGDEEDDKFLTDEEYERKHGKIKRKKGEWDFDDFGDDDDKKKSGEDEGGGGEGEGGGGEGEEEEGDDGM